jgi:hypothetical protein
MSTGENTKSQDEVVYAESLVVGPAGSRKTITGTEINAIDGVTPGTVTASKALVVDANKDLAALRHLTITGNFVSGATTISEAELGYLDGQTAGTVAASKAALPDANKDIGTFRNLRTARVIHSEGAPTSDATVGPRTYTAAEILGGIIVRDTNGAGRSDVLPTAALLVAALPGAAVGDIIDCLIINGADAAETLTIGAGTGGGFDTNQTAASRVIAQNGSKLLRIRLTNVTALSEAYVAYL